MLLRGRRAQLDARTEYDGAIITAPNTDGRKRSIATVSNQEHLMTVVSGVAEPMASLEDLKEVVLRRNRAIAREIFRNVF